MCSTPVNRRRGATPVKTNIGPNAGMAGTQSPARGVPITQTTYDDVAAKLGIDSYDVFLRNLQSRPADKADVYREQMKVAAKIMDWKKKYRPHGKGRAKGSVVTGLGMGIHTWGGAGHNSTCTVKIHPDGGVETFLGSQDLGTGTRTAIGMVVAETLGLPISAVKVNIGSSTYPASGPSGGSTTIGGVSESNRRARNRRSQTNCSAMAAGKLGVPRRERSRPQNGKIQVSGKVARVSPGKKLASLLGMTPMAKLKVQYLRGQNRDA